MNMRVAVDVWVIKDGWNMDDRRAFELSSARMTIWEEMERIVGGIYESRSQDINVYHQE